MSLYDFYLDHQEGVITTLIGLTSTIAASYYAKKDGEKVTRKYKGLYENALIELQQLKRKLQELHSHSKEHDESSKKMGDLVTNISQQLEGSAERDVTVPLITSKLIGLLKAGNIQEAENYYKSKKSVLTFPPLVLYYEGLLAKAKRDFPNALHHLEQITACYTKEQVVDLHVIYEIIAGIYLQELHDYGPAARAFEAAYAIRPEVQYLYGMMECFSNLKQWDGVKVLLDNLQSKYGDDPVYLNFSSSYLHAMGSTEQSLDTLDKALSIAPNSATLWIRKACIVWDTGDKKEGIAHARRAFSLNSKSASILLKLCDFYLQYGDLDQAYHEAQLYRRMFPRDYYFLNLYFGLLLRLHKIAEAVRLGDSLDFSRLMPSSPAAANNLGTAYLMDNQPEKAMSLFDLVLSYQPDSASTLLSICYLHLYFKTYRDTDKAFRYAEKASHLSPGACDPLLAMGEARLFAFQFDEAKYFYEQADQRNPGSAGGRWTLYHLLKRTYVNQGEAAAKDVVDQQTLHLSIK